MSTPEQIGKYTITGVAGEGNMAIVYTGHDPFTDEEVAIKVCPVAAGSGFKIARKLFFNEAHTAGSLEHPNILSVRDGGEHDGYPYIVMEYIEGADTLRSYISPDSLLPIARVIEILYQCAKALDYAHRRGVIHRDIKPSNVMLTRDGVVKIGDFGIAQHALSDETQLMGMLGSPRYMSPEQVREEDLTHQSDIFSLGVVSYELITGAPPFSGKTIAQLVRKIVDEEPAAIRTLRSDTPPELCAIVARALAKKVTDRYEYAHEMAADLASLFGRLDHTGAAPNQDERYKIARQLSFFNDFSDQEVLEVVRAANWRTAAPGALLVAENTAATAFYILVEGEASVQVSGAEVGLLVKGECFGEMAVLTHTDRAASVIAIDECTLLRVESRVLDHASAGCQLRFNKMFLQTLIRRLSHSNTRLVLARKS
jgi:serine/threonine protein kinase